MFSGNDVDIVTLTESEVGSLVSALGMHLKQMLVLTFDEVMNFDVPLMRQGLYTGGDKKESIYVKAVHPKI